MGKIEILLPVLGEGVIDATLTKWVKQVGDTVEEDQTIAEVATDKVDSEIPSPYPGQIVELRAKEGDLVPVGQVIAIIKTEGPDQEEEAKPAQTPSASQPDEAEQVVEVVTKTSEGLVVETEAANDFPRTSPSGRFLSPLVRSIAKTEGIGPDELDRIAGTGKEGRLTKEDLLAYLSSRSAAKTAAPAQPQAPQAQKPAPQPQAAESAEPSKPKVAYGSNYELVEMDRMRKLIAKNMVESKRVSPHVAGFVEVDMTPIVEWREKNKASFEKKYGTKITFMPFFIEAMAKAARDFPMVNVSVDGETIVIKKDVNIGMAAATPDGNLIVPVIKQADEKNLVGLAKSVNDLAQRARAGKLKLEEISGGTITITNMGSFGNLTGVPIINQPEVAILSVGIIKKKPAVVETPYGDVVAVRQMMVMCLSYDHRIVDGMLGGSYLKRVADYLEAFDPNQKI